MKCIILKNDYEMIEKMESLRKNAFGFDDNNKNQYYVDKIMNKSMIMLACVHNDRLLGGAYITNRFNKLHIESIFVDKALQKSELHIGTRMMRYILNNVELFEKLFVTKFYFSSLEPLDEEITAFYNKFGYYNNDSESLYLRKKLKKKKNVK